MTDTIRANEELSESHPVFGQGASGPEPPAFDWILRLW
jgi:hypothetical protein